MKLEVGMYVRTTKGIAKIISRILEPDNYYFKCWVTDKFLCICDDTEYLCDSDILKASYNIIDILKIGDYVNGERVIYKQYKEYPNPLLDHYVVDTTRCSYIESEIKTIVTKEQFEQMAYKVGGVMKMRRNKYGK